MERNMSILNGDSADTLQDDDMDCEIQEYSLAVNTHEYLLFHNTNNDGNDTTRHLLQSGTIAYMSNNSDDIEGQSTRDTHIVEKHTLNSQTDNPYPDIPQYVLDAIHNTSMRNRIYNSESADFPIQQTHMQLIDTHNNINDECLFTQESTQHVLDTDPNLALLSMHTWDTAYFTSQKSDNHPPMTFMESDQFIPAGTDFTCEQVSRGGIGNKRRLHDVVEDRNQQFNSNDYS